MARRAKKQRNYKTISFKVYYDTDKDILSWWDSITDGDRSDAVRDLIRHCLGIQKPANDLIELRRDAIWIKEAINEMPQYFERMVQDIVSRVQQPATAYITEPPRTVPQPNSLSDTDTQRRANRLKKATW